MREVVPDLPVGVEYAAMRRWSKEAEEVRDDRGRLIPWEPSAEPGAPTPAEADPECPAGTLAPAGPAR